METLDLALEPEIVDYIAFLEIDEQETTGFLTHRKVLDNFKAIGDAMNTLIVYPDILADIITPSDNQFRLHFFQRLMLRGMARYEQVFYTFARGTSKSFLAFFDRYVHAMMIPNHKTGILAGSNKQAAKIAKEKIIDDLWVRFPLLANEMQKRRIAGKIKDAYNSRSDYVEFNFKNGSSLDIASDRGLRRNSAIFEEVIEQDPVFVNEIAIPWLNKPRTNYFGKINPHEPQSQKIFVTTAGFQGTFSYNKMIETMCFSILYPTKYLVLSGTYKIPLDVGLTTQSQMNGIIGAPTFDRTSFDREYKSGWSNAPQGAAFSPATVSKLRKVKKVELKSSLNDDEEKAFYVLSADMAKDGEAATAMIVAKVIPGEFFFKYRVVNLFTMDTTDYLQVANRIKQAIVDYNIRLFIYDANGIGAALRDWLNKETVAQDGMRLSGYGIINPPANSQKDVIRYPREYTICYEIKSGGQRGNEIHHFFFSRMSNGSVLFPIKSSEAIDLLRKNEKFMNSSLKHQQLILAPYRVMDLMEEELKNLDIVDTSDNVNYSMRIVRRDPKIQKDFFSAIEYLVYGVNQHLEIDYYKKQRVKGNNLMDSLIFETGGTDTNGEKW